MRKAKILFALTQDCYYGKACVDVIRMSLDKKNLGFCCDIVRSESEIFQSITSDDYPHVIVLDAALKKKYTKLCKNVKRALVKNDRDSVIILFGLDSDNKWIRRDRKHHGVNNGADFVFELLNGMDPNVINTLAMAVDNTNKKMYLEKIGHIDGMTGCWKKEYFEMQFEPFKNECQRNNKKMAMFFLDIDHFKNVNDKYGHSTGDEVLIHFANTVRSSIRDYDMFCRYGGEEFVVLASVETKVDGQILAEKIRQAVEINPLEGRFYNQHGETDCISPTVSIGQIIVRAGEGLDQAKERADGLLYEAKGEGRNRVVSDFGKPEILYKEGKTIVVNFKVA